MIRLTERDISLHCTKKKREGKVFPHPASFYLFKFRERYNDGLDSSRRETLKTGLRIEIDPLLVEAIDFQVDCHASSIQL